MRVVPISQTPNQSFTLTIDGVRWGVGLREARGVMVVDILRDGVVLITGSRALSGEALIPYRYLETANFIFITVGDVLPNWHELGVSQFLIYADQIEIARLPAPLPAPKTSSYLTSDDGFYLTTDDGSLLTDD